jgi:AAA ATPase domain
MSSPNLDELAQLLADSWAKRSPAEKKRFVNRVNSPVDAEPSAESLRQVHERGALSGAVAPRDLARGLSTEDANRVLDAALVDFDRTLVGGTWCWTMRNGPRRRMLARLAASGALPRVLADVNAIDTDVAGEVLRELARTGDLNPAAALDLAPEQRTRVVLQALSWAEPLGGHAGDLAEARRQAGIAAIRDSYETLLQQGFYGRGKELTRLREFAEAPVHPGRPVPFLAVTGIGGSGKSTLLAEFVRPYLQRLSGADPAVPAVVVIDFDRVHFRANAEIELSFELTRQLGYAAPVASADFSVLRHQERQERRRIGTDVSQGSVTLEGNTRSSSGFDYEAGALVRMHSLEDRPVVLVLDTFEEWQRDRPLSAAPRGDWNDPEQRIMQWIWRLRHEMRLGGLRVIASGRAGVEHTDGVRAMRPLRLGDLSRSAATRMLDVLGVAGQPGVALYRAVGGNPLTLRVAARFFDRLSTEERQRFAADVRREGTGLDEDLRRAVLYDRYLDHIADERVRKLAHPGLALRRVTPYLVRHILAVHCGLGNIDGRTAHELTERLADEVWLVRSTPDGLRHQPDVRRAMLNMMTDDPDHAAAVRAIHQAAVDWYATGRDPNLSREAAEVEWFYHTLMLESGDRSILTLHDDMPIARLAVSLGTGVADLKPLVRQQVCALRGEDIPDAGVEGLPSDVWGVWFDERGARLIADDHPQRALDLFQRRLAREQNLAEPMWLAQAFCDTARWSEYWESMPSSTRLSDVLRSGRYAFLNALSSSKPRHLELYNESLSRYIDGHYFAASAFERAFLGLLAEFPSEMISTWTRELNNAKQSMTGIDLYPVDQLRRALVWAVTSQAESRFSLELTAGLFRPDPDWVAAWERIDTIDGYHRSAFPLPAPGRLRSDETLGEVSSSFARVWPRLELRRDRLAGSEELRQVLRGDNPELRPAIRLAVDAVADQHGLSTLGEIATDLLPIPASDLQPDVLRREGLMKGRNLIVQLVEYVDRSGVMRQFLAAARAAHPDVELLGRVDDAFVKWDDTYNRLLARIG